jgi:hypothetical protein
MIGELFKVQNTMNPKQRSGFNTLEMPCKDVEGHATDDSGKATSWKTTTIHKEIEAQLIQRNISHFGQANGTLFGSTEFQQDFGYTGTGETVKKLLNGEYIS